MNDFFSADWHFDHRNIIKFSDRPFSTTQDMDEELIRRHNALVKPGDRFFFLGDVSITGDVKYVRSLLARLNGQKFWILGNHDHEIERDAYGEFFQKIEKLMDLRIGKGPLAQHIVLCHYAMLSWNKCHHGSWMLHGHDHGSLKYPIPGKICDVGVDCWNYAPVSYEELKTRLDPMPATKHHAMQGE